MPPFNCYKADDALTRGEFARRIEAQYAREQELAVSPAFFQSLVRHLPRLSRVEIRPKRGLIHNEMTRFRYDVVLRVEPDQSPDRVPAGYLARLA